MTIETSAPENPPAFPKPDVYGADGFGIAQGQPGMTLRDWFAGQALIGLAMKDPWREPSQHAVIAYSLADALLAARAEGGAR